MQDITLTIKEYKASRELLQERIHELNAEIAKKPVGKEDSSTKRLHERRMKLYTELWDIEYAIREMQEYLHSIQDVIGNVS